MQKPANRILSALLVLVMVLSMLPATVFAASETESALMLQLPQQPKTVTML